MLNLSSAMRAASLLLVLAGVGCMPASGGDTASQRSVAAAQAAQAPARESYGRTDVEIPANPADDLVFEYR